MLSAAIRGRASTDPIWSRKCGMDLNNYPPDQKKHKLRRGFDRTPHRVTLCE
jgi:hypothetical protein